MSAAVLEIAEKAKKLTPQEWDEMLEMLEDIEDNAAADKALAEGEFIPWEKVKAEMDEQLRLVNLTALLRDCSQDGETGYCATCAEIPSAIGQGESVEECLADLRECITFIFESNKQEALASRQGEVRELQLA